MDEDVRRRHRQSEDVAEPLIREDHQGNTTTFLEEIKKNVVLSLIGIILFFGGVGLQFWNEGRAVDRARALHEGLAAAVSVSASSRVSPETEGVLVHLTAALDVPQQLTEPTYGVAVAAVRLKRRVQMYQWVEEQTSRTVEGTDGQQTETSYHYYKQWKDKLVDSSTFNSPFNHQNPKSLPLESRVQEAELAFVGHYRVSPELRDLFNKYTIFASDRRPEDRSIKLHGDIFYHCENIEAPRVGDHRVQFSYAGKAGDTVSVVGRQQGDAIVPHLTSNGHRLLLLQPGRRSQHHIFADELNHNRALTWWVRGGGWLLTFLGLSCLTNVLNVLVRQFPVVREVVALGVTSLNLSVSVAASLAAVALSWLWFRPLVGLGLLVAAALPVWWRARWAAADQWEPRPPRMTVVRPRGLFRAGRPPPYGFRVPS